MNVAFVLEAMAIGETRWVEGFGRSMWPLVRSGDSFLFERCARSALRAGDVGVFVDGRGRLVAHPVVSTRPLRTSSLQGVEDVQGMRVLGRAQRLRTRGREVEVESGVRALLQTFARTAMFVRDSPRIAGAARVVRDAALGPSTRSVRAAVLGEVRARVLDEGDRRETLAFIGHHGPALSEHAMKTFSTRWQKEGYAVGAFARDAMVGMVFVDEYRVEGVPLDGIWVRSFYVASWARGLGVGTSLLDVVVSEARRRRMRICADVSFENEVSKRRFLAAGFQLDELRTAEATAMWTQRRGPGSWVVYRFDGAAAASG